MESKEVNAELAAKITLLSDNLSNGVQSSQTLNTEVVDGLSGLVDNVSSGVVPAQTLNTEYIDNLEKKIDTTKSCSVLAKLTEEILKYFGTLLAGLGEQLAKLMVLINPPSIDDVVTWVADFIDFALVGPYNLMLKLYIALITKMTELMSKLSAKSLSFPNCDINLGGALTDAQAIIPDVSVSDVVPDVSVSSI